VTSIERTAYPRFKRFLSAWGVARVLHAADGGDRVGEASGQARSDNHLLALMVQLKCFNRMGYFLRLDEVPEAVANSALISGWARTSPRCTTRTGPGAIIGC